MDPHRAGPSIGTVLTRQPMHRSSLLWDAPLAGEEVPGVLTCRHRDKGPLAVRWKGAKITTDHPMHVLRAYRVSLASLRPNQIVWEPYRDFLGSLWAAHATIAKAPPFHGVMSYNDEYMVWYRSITVRHITKETSYWDTLVESQLRIMAKFEPGSEIYTDFAMEGTEQNRGVNYKTLEHLFNIAKERSETFTYNISVSVLEVYNDQIRDLLATSPTSKMLEIKQASEGSHHVPGIVETKVDNIKDVWSVLQAGSNARAVGSNNMHALYNGKSKELGNNAIKAFSPLKLRLGGTLQDKVIYDTPDDQQPCVAFANKSSEMFGFTQGDWNYTNAESLIRYTVIKNYTIHGWELGNELSGNGVGTRVAADQYALDTVALQRIVQNIYKEVEPKPKIIAPGGFFDANWFKEFLDKTSKSLDVVTHHIYNLGPGVDQHLIEKILDPSYLDGEGNTFRSLHNIVRSSATSAVAWVGEAGGAYNNGHNLVTNAFVFSFWYLDQLGMASSYAIKTYCRQTFIGGNYGLLNTTTFEPNPDYYRHPGIQAIFRDTNRDYLQPPITEHRYCLRHLCSNVNTRWNNETLKNLVWRAASATQERKFNATFDLIKNVNQDVHQYLKDVPKEKWALTFDGPHSSTNNDSDMDSKTAIGSQAYGDTSRTNPGFFNSIVYWCKFWRTDPNSDILSDQSNKKLDQINDYSKRHELFSEDSFWSDMESFMGTPNASVIVSHSWTREEMAQNLQNEGPLAHRSLTESDVLHLVDLLISERKWVVECPSQTSPFKLTSSIGKSAMIQSRGSNGLTSIFSATSPKHDEDLKYQNTLHTGVSPPVINKKPSVWFRSDILADCQKLVTEILKEYPEGHDMGSFRKLFLESWIDAAKFMTGASAVGSIVIPIILRHAHMIETGAMLIEFTSFFIFACTVMCFHRASLEEDW
ncbi:hypothetical protein CMV_022680 [Castanea mollissima]|uniref:Kinesin motor domain-containing protein n=1 Tax=Castanea mollissima TaxID=60419 RepID=A0A8J4QI11_9ROSI|nr:hypothetical protein CMV_022680 [Castanea mollissima]